MLIVNWLDRKLYKRAWWRKWRGLPEPVKLSASMAMVTNEAFRLLRSAALADIDNTLMARGYLSDAPTLTVKIRRPVAYAPRGE